MANIVRFDPFSEMLTLREAMNSLLEDSVVRPTTARGQMLAMPLDVSETQDAFIVEASVPGVKPEDFDITLQDNVLTISAETRQEQTSGDKPNYHRVERRYGRFSRSIGLPTQVQSDNVQATLNNGILRLEIPKAEAVKPRKIAVSSGANSGQSQTVNVTPQGTEARQG